jgi:hypothetical protein
MMKSTGATLLTAWWDVCSSKLFIFFAMNLPQKGTLRAGFFDFLPSCQVNFPAEIV